MTLGISPTLLYPQASGYVENKGQWTDEVQAHYAYGTAGMWFLNDRVRFSVLNREQSAKAVEAWHDMTPQSGVVNGFVYDMVFGSTEQTSLDLVGKKKAHLNYFLGSNPKRWKSEVGQYHKSVVHEVKTGIDVSWEIENGHPKYTLMVGKRADLDDVYIDYHGVRSLEVNSGRLEIGLGKFTIQEMEPIAYQLYNDRRIPVACSFRVEGTRLFFDLGQYNEDYMLYIDPIIVASTHSGSTAEAFGHSATFDGPGNIYSAGRVFGVGYPTDTGSYDIDYNGPFSGQYQDQYDVCISKYNPDGSELLYATYLGGSLRELPHSLIVNSQNQLLVLGSVLSSDFPTTVNAYDTSHNGGQDIYVAKFSSNGSQLLASTFLGGASDDGVNTIIENYADDFRGEVVTDDSGNVYIASFTQSSDFPSTIGVVQDSLAGGQDGVIARLDGSLSQLTFSTFLGGQDDDAAFALKVGEQGRVYVTGTTESQDFPVDSAGGGASTSNNGGDSDAFILSLNSTGTQIINSTYFGTIDRDHGFFLELDGDEDIYILGWSNGNITSTPGKYEGPTLGSYVAKLSNQLDTVEWEIGFGRFSPAAFLVDVCSHIYVSGQEATNPAVNPLNTNTFDTLNTFSQLTSAGFYVMALSPEADQLEHAFFYGTNNSHVDGGTSRFDKRGYVYQDVCNCLGDFPTVPWAYADTNAASAPPPSLVCDNCAFKVDFELPLVAAYAEADVYEGCQPLEVNFSNLGSVGTTHFWDFGDGQTSVDSMPTHMFDSSGVYKVVYTISDTFGCNATDSAVLYITVGSSDPIEIGYDTTDCVDSVQMYLVHDMASSILWSTGDETDSSYATTSGTYWLIADRIGCGIDTDTVVLEWHKPPHFSLPPDTGVCNLNFNIAGPDSALIYQWNTGDTTQTITPITTGLYALTISDSSCTASDTMHVSVSYIGFNDSDTSTCQDSMLLEIQEESGEIVWNTGDTTANVWIDESGTYWVTISNGFCVLSDTIDAYFNPPFLVDRADTTICEPIDYSVFDSTLSGYQWHTGDTASYISIDTSMTIWYAVEKGACADTDTVRIDFPRFEFERSNYIVCNSDSFIITAPGSPKDSFIWNTGDTTATIRISKPGLYTVSVTGEFCSGIDSVGVQFKSAPEFSLGGDQRICRGDRYTFNLDSIHSEISWNTGDTTHKLTVSDSGTYIATVMYEGCYFNDTAEIRFQTVHLDSFFIIPNVITPNGDGLNDDLGLRMVKPDLITDYQLTVYNRWGVLMFDSKYINHNWDGTNPAGNDVEEGTYFYLFEGKTICTDMPVIEVKDNVTVLR